MWRGFQQRKLFKRMQEKTQEKKKSGQRDFLKRAPGPPILKVAFAAQERNQQSKKTQIVDPNTMNRRLSVQLQNSHKANLPEKSRGVAMMNALLNSHSPKLSELPSQRSLNHMKSLDNIDLHSKNMDRLTSTFDDKAEPYK